MVGSWRLVAAGGWQRLVAGGWWRLVVGGWWSLGAVLKGGPEQKKKKISSLKDPPAPPFTLPLPVERIRHEEAGEHGLVVAVVDLPHRLVPAARHLRRHLARRRGLVPQDAVRVRRAALGAVGVPLELVRRGPLDVGLLVGGRTRRAGKGEGSVADVWERCWWW